MKVGCSMPLDGGVSMGDLRPRVRKIGIGPECVVLKGY